MPKFPNRVAAVLSIACLLTDQANSAFILPIGRQRYEPTCCLSMFTTQALDLPHGTSPNSDSVEMRTATTKLTKQTAAINAALPAEASSTWAAKHLLKLTRPKGAVITAAEIDLMAVQIAWWWETFILFAVSQAARFIWVFSHHDPGFLVPLAMVLGWHAIFIWSHSEGYYHWVDEELVYTPLVGPWREKRSVLTQIGIDGLRAYGLFYVAFLFFPVGGPVTISSGILTITLLFGAYRHWRLLEKGKIDGRPLPVTTGPPSEPRQTSGPEASDSPSISKAAQFFLDVLNNISMRDLEDLKFWYPIRQRRWHYANLVALHWHEQRRRSNKHISFFLRSARIVVRGETLTHKQQGPLLEEVLANRRMARSS